MTEWQRRLRQVLEAACEEQPPDPDSVAAALGLVYAEQVLQRPPPEAAYAARLRQRGASCLSRLTREILQTGDPEGEARLLASVVRAGSSVLDGTPMEDVSAFAGAFTPEAGRVVDLVACRLEGLQAASVAAALSRDELALERARLLARVRDRSLDELMEAAEPTAPRFRVAAGDVLPLRDPATGRVVGHVAEPAIEAVLFEAEAGELRLALYAAEPVALRLEAEGATTEDMQPGYWLGRLAPNARTLEAKVYFADRESPWSIRLFEDA